MRILDINSDATVDTSFEKFSSTYDNFSVAGCACIWLTSMAFLDFWINNQPTPITTMVITNRIIVYRDLFIVCHMMKIPLMLIRIDWAFDLFQGLRRCLEDIFLCRCRSYLYVNDKTYYI